MEAPGTIQKPYSISIIDATSNRKGWEYRATEELEQSLLDLGLRSSRTRADGLKDLQKACIELPSESNIIVFMAHGAKGDDETPARIRVGKEDPVSPQLFKDYVDSSLSDKLVILLVCEGSNIDSAWSFFNVPGGSPLFLVASKQKLTRDEAISFTPAFVSELKRYPSLGRTEIEAAMAQTNEHANGKTEVLP